MNEKNTRNVYRIGGAYLQCMNNHYTKFQYKGMKIVGVTDYTNLTHPTHFGHKTDTPYAFWMEKMSKFNTRTKCENIYQMCTKLRDAQLQCVNNHYAKFEYKGMKTI